MKKHAATKLELETLQAELEYTKIHLRVCQYDINIRNCLPLLTLNFSNSLEVVKL